MNAHKPAQPGITGLRGRAYSHAKIFGDFCMVAKLETRVKGLSFTRAAIAMALGSGRPDSALRIAEERWGQGESPALAIKAATRATTSGDVTSAGFAADEFFGAVFERSIVGRLAGLRRVNFHSRALSVESGASAFWVAEGAAVPISRAALDFYSLPAMKVAAQTIATTEALRSADPLVEMGLRADLMRAATEALDLAFLDPDNAGVAGAKPASVAYGSTEVGALSDSFGEIFDAFGGDLGAAYFILHPSHAARLCTPEMPLIGARGGEIAGVPALTSRQMPVGKILLLDPTAVAFAGGGGEVKSSTEATVEVIDEPTGSAITPTGATTISLFQENLTALGASIAANWVMMRSGAAVFVDLGTAE